MKYVRQRGGRIHPHDLSLPPEAKYDESVDYEGDNAMGRQHTQKVDLDPLEDFVRYRWLYATANRRATIYGSCRRLGGVTLFTWRSYIPLVCLLKRLPR